MGDIDYNRCPQDDWKAGTAPVGVNPETGQAIELNINGVAATLSVQACLVTLSAAMKAGYEEDFLEKIALCLYGKVVDDPHSLCPLLTVLGMILLMVRGQAVCQFDENNRVIITPPDTSIESGPMCMYGDYEEGDNDGSNEGPVDSDGTGEGGEGDGINPA